MMYTTKKV